MTPFASGTVGLLPLPRTVSAATSVRDGGGPTNNHYDQEDPMHSPTRSGVRRLCAVLLVLMAAATPGVAADGKTHHQRLSAIKNGLPAKAIDHWKKTAEGSYALTYILWPPKECLGAPGPSSPGLTTKVLDYRGTDVDPQAVYEIQYDRHGNVIRRDARQLNRRGTWDTEVTECAYDDGAGELNRGKLVYWTQHHSVFGKSYVYRATYNSRDQHETETEDYDWDDDGAVDYRLIIRYVYDETGRLVQQRFEGDDGADGTTDGVSAGMASYDAQGRITRIVEGYYDVPGGTFIPARTMSVIFDDTNAMTIATHENDYDGDGVADALSRYTSVYDNDGRPVHSVHESDDYGRSDGGADGVIDSRSEIRNEYDADGNLVEASYETLFDRFGVPYREEYVSEYDTRGRLIRTDGSVDVPTDGVPDEFFTATYTRDEHGRVVEWIMVSSTRFSSHKRGDLTTYEYSPVGNLIERVDSSWLNDDPPTVDHRTTYEHAAGRSPQKGSYRR